jgi:hypothetical protein
MSAWFFQRECYNGVMKTEIKWALGLTMVVFIVAGLNYAIMTSKGYHLQWSAANGRMIWVDKDGKVP